MGQAKTIGQNLGHEAFGGQFDDGCVERQFKQDVDAEFLKTVRPGGGVHEAERRGVRGKEFARVRLERQDA